MNILGMIAAHLKTLILPPRFADPDKTRQASLLYIILLTLFGTNFLQIASFALAARDQPLETNLFVWAIEFAFLVLARQGHIRSVSFVMCITVWLIIVLVAYSNSGLFNPILGGLFLVIFIAGLLINEFAVLLFVAISTASIIFLGQAARQGLLPTHSVTVTLEQATANYIGGFILTAVIGFLALRSINQAMTQLRHHKTALEEANRLLEKDIAERKHAEHALAESESLFRQMAENIHEIFWLYDHILNIFLYVSPAYESIWGHPLRGILEKPLSIWDTFHPEDRNGAWESFRQFIKSPQESYTIEYRIIRQDNETRWIMSRFFPVTDADGKMYRIVGISRDITEHKKAQDMVVEAERLRGVLESEREFSQLKDRLMRTISHEFRTPLAVVTSAVDLLEHYPDRVEPVKRIERLQGIRAQMIKLAHMLDDISLAIYGTGHLKFKPDVIDLEHLCSQLVEETEQTIGAKHVFTFKAEGELHDVVADERLLNRAVSNLLYNAVKYSAPETEIHIDLTNQDDREAVLRIRDHGIGIPLDEQPHIFEPFYRASNTGKVGGTGLGLRIVKDCVIAHGGAISFESTTGVGTTFTVRLPLRQMEKVTV